MCTHPHTHAVRRKPVFDLVGAKCRPLLLALLTVQGGLEYLEASVDCKVVFGGEHKADDGYVCFFFVLS
jgi:hypothetical protein